MKEYKVKINGEFLIVSKEIYILFSQEREKERHYNNKKREKFKFDPVACKAVFEESRLDSIDRLCENKIQIADKSKNVEDYITTKVDLERAFDKLTSKERYVIKQYYFYRRTEVEIAKDLNMTRAVLNKYKASILAKLHKFLEN